MGSPDAYEYLPPDSQIHYDRFVARIARLYVERFSRPR